MSRKPVTNVLAPSGAHDVFCNGARGMKELARFPDLGSCYNAAKVDSDCDITHGVAYAVQANDPTDTWRADRCTCVRKTCNGPWHATDRIFARYECTVKYTRHRSMLRYGNNWILSDDDLIPTDPVCVTNDDWTPPFCRNGKFPQGLAIGIDRCKVACAARPKCKAIGIGHPTRGTGAECFLAGEVNDQDNPLMAYGHWDFYDIEEVCKPALDTLPD